MSMGTDYVSLQWKFTLCLENNKVRRTRTVEWLKLEQNVIQVVTETDRQTGRPAGRPTGQTKNVKVCVCVVMVCRRQPMTRATHGVSAGQQPSSQLASNTDDASQKRFLQQLRDRGARFVSSQQQQQANSLWVALSGLTVVYVHSHRLLVDVMCQSGRAKTHISTVQMEHFNTSQTNYCTVTVCCNCNNNTGRLGGGQGT